MNFSEQHGVETYRSLIAVSMEGLKALLLINGGAVVAMLAYLQSPHGVALTRELPWPLALFASGVFWCVLAFFGAYATQFALYNETIRSPVYQGWKHMRFLWITLVLISLSVLSFIAGAICTIWLLSRQNPLPA